MKELVIFDVDNTILKGFSQGLFVSYLYKKGEVTFLYRLIIVLWMIFYKLGLLKDPKPAMEYGLSFIKGKKKSEVEIIVDDFFNTVWVKKMYSESEKIINDHKLNGREVMLVSNAPDILIEKLSRYLGINKFISTKLEIVNGIYTGKIIGDIMYSKQKLNAVNSYIQLNQLSFENSWGYGDHDTDAFLLSKVTHAYAVNPSKKLKKIALQNNWPILNFKL